MKILIVDDNPIASERIREMLSAAPDMSFLEISDSRVAHRLVEFGIDIDVALIDLRYVHIDSALGESEGLSICQKVRLAMPEVVIVGYSTSFSLESEESNRLRKKFLDMGADIVCALDHLTLTPTSELRYQFQAAREMRTAKRKRLRDRIFIGSSTEGLRFARQIQMQLSREYEVVLWDNTVFALGEVTIESLEKAVRSYQFAVFVLTADDDRTSRGVISKIPRDNVIFEAGLFLGSLGRTRAFVVQEDNKVLAVPSDLAGLTVTRFLNDYENLAAAMGPVCQRIRDAIDSVSKEDPLGPGGTLSASKE